MMTDMIAFTLHTMTELRTKRSWRIQINYDLRSQTDIRSKTQLIQG